MMVNSAAGSIDALSTDELANILDIFRRKILCVLVLIQK